MVVTRRTPNVPTLPSTSRTSSSQAVARMNKGKAAQMSSLADSDDPFANGRAQSQANPDHSGPQFSDDAVFSDGPSSPKKSAKSKQKSKKRERKRAHRNGPANLVDLLARMFLLFFFIYTATVCPNDTHLRSPVCHGLAEYKRLVLEPYLILPIRGALNHPKVAPYIAMAKPHYDTAVQNVKPVVERTRKEWRRRVIPQWNKRVVPYLKELDARVDPYRQKLIIVYQKHLAPHYATLQRYSRKAQPYLFLTAARTYDTYVAFKPHLLRTTKELQKFPPVLYNYVVRPLVLARREFVDPHVARMVITIKELSRSDKHEAAPSAVPSLVQEVEQDTTADATTLSPSVDSASADVSDADVTSEHTKAVTSVAVNVVTLPEAILEVSTANVVSDISTDADPQQTSSSVPHVASTEASIPEPSAAAAATINTAASAFASAAADRVLLVQERSADVDLDDFVKDLGLDLDDSPTHSPSTPSDSSAAPQEGNEVDDEEAERLKAEFQRVKAEETAEKRRDIEARHTKWEHKVQESIVEQRQAVLKVLEDVRKTAAAELRNSQPFKNDVDALDAEADKALRGTEAYFAKLKTEDRVSSEKVKLWERVLSKVWDKFEERVGSVESAVKKWIQDVTAREIEEIESAAAIVKGVAEEGQADIGLDYAWLDDVTYLDWRRYHALLDNHKTFLEQAKALQNGSDPSAPSNPLGSILEDLQSEIKDLIVGFETRFRRIRRAGERTFASDASSGTEQIDLEAEPQVSILPVPDAGARNPAMPPDDAQEAIADAIVGRSEEEVVDALRRAAGSGDAASTSTLVPPTGEQHAASKIAHVEL